MNSTVMFGIAAVPAIVGLVQVAKDMGLAARFSPALAVLLGILAAVGQELATASPALQPIVAAVFAGVALGLSASGLYSGAKTIFPRPTSIRGA